MNDFIYTKCDGNEIIESSYYDSILETKGLFYLQYNRKCFFLFVPTKYISEVEEMKTGSYAVFTTGFDRITRKDSIEIMFEDYSDKPFCLHLAIDLFQFRIDESFDNLKFMMKIHTPIGKVHEVEVYVRSGKTYLLPYLKPIDISNYSAA